MVRIHSLIFASLIVASVANATATCDVLLRHPPAVAAAAQKHGVEREVKTEAPVPESANPQIVTLTELRQNVYAVHATNYFPEGGVIRSDLNGHLLVRPETHFALGALVQGHSLGTWETSRYAVVTRLENLEPQLINLFIHDTTILGDFSLPAGTIVVMPEGENTQLPKGVTAFHYKLDQYGALRAAVASVIEKQGGFVFDVEMSNGTQDDYVSSDSSEKFSGVNLNTRDFLSPMLDGHPGVTNTIHTNTSLGAIDLWLGMGLATFADGRPYLITTSQLSFERDVIALSLRRLKSELPWTRLPIVAKSKLQASLLRLRNYLNIIDADLKLRTELGKTALQSPEKFKDEIWKRMESPTALEQYLRSQASQLDVVSQVLGSGRVMSARSLARFSPAEVRGLYRGNQANFGATSEADFMRSYAASRIFLLSHQLNATQLNELVLIRVPNFAELNFDEKKAAVAKWAGSSKAILKKLNLF